MAKLCLYCGSQIGFARSLRGETFCSSEHSELHRQDQSVKAFDRVLSQSAPLPARKPETLALTESPLQAGARQSVTSTFENPTPNGDPKHAAPFPFVIPKAVPPPPVTLTEPQAECLDLIRSASSQLRLAEPVQREELTQPDKLAQLEQIEYADSPAVPEPVTLPSSFEDYPIEPEFIADASVDEREPESELVAVAADETAPPELVEPRSGMRRGAIYGIAGGLAVLVIAAMLFSTSSSTKMQPSAAAQEHPPVTSKPAPAPSRG